MKTRVILLLVALLAMSTAMEAGNWDKRRNRKSNHVERRYNHHVQPVKAYRTKTVAVLPYGYTQVRYNSGIYYYANGVYYRPTPNRYYEVVMPHIGMVVPRLPYYQKVKVRGRTYYAYQDYLYAAIRTPYGINYRVEIRL